MNPVSFQPLTPPQATRVSFEGWRRKSDAAAARSPEEETPRMKRAATSPLLMKLLGPVNDCMALGGYFKVKKVHMPKVDRLRLRLAVNPDTAGFMGPNHPEFMTDWLMDKWISTRFAPTMASWAAGEIVNDMGWLMRRFWQRNNLIAHNSGKVGQNYSIKQAMAGKGVLLHPEGSVSWKSNEVQPLLPGIVSMALQSAHRLVRAGEADARPVYSIPLVWKLQFTRDVSKGLLAEMAEQEKKLGLKPHKDSPLPVRFFMLQQNILRRQMEKFGFPDDELARYEDFFGRQKAFQDALIAEMTAKYPQANADGEATANVEKLAHRLNRIIKTELKAVGEDKTKKAALKLDLAKAGEISRLNGFSASVYNTPLLSQEQIAESLKRNHRDLLGNKGLRNTLAYLFPKPVGPRVAHVRVPQALDITAILKNHPDYPQYAALPELPEAFVDQVVPPLLAELRQRMQTSLDDINRRIAPEVEKFSVRNPFYNSGDN